MTIAVDMDVKHQTKQANYHFYIYFFWILIIGCWIATHHIEIYYKAGNAQLFPLMHRSGGFLLGRDYLAGGVPTLVFIYVQYSFDYL